MRKEGIYTLFETLSKTTNSFSVRFRIFAVNNKSGSVMIIYNV